MVAKITVPNSIKSALNYHEQKVCEGMAKCIHAHNFLKDSDALNFYEKLHRFEALLTLNKRATTNLVHISLNFAIDEKLSCEKLIEIAGVYMQKIGFDEQPYLVYEHFDAGHPHIHIVTTNIQKDGKRISLHNLGKNQSSLARKEIEIAYNLTKAEEQNKKQIQKINPVSLQKVIYGKSPTKRAIANVLEAVLPRYKYSSLPQLNAVLKQYNVYADKGEPGSKTAEHQGLFYRILNENGNKVGVPIKASSIPGKPTLRYLEEKFKVKEVLKQADRQQLKSALDWVLLKKYPDIDTFKKALEKEKITLVAWQNNKEVIYELIYIDHATKSVFNGCDIGKEYSAKAILEKCGFDFSTTQINHCQKRSLEKPVDTAPGNYKTIEIQQDLVKALPIMASPVEEYTRYPSKKQEKKRKQSSTR